MKTINDMHKISTLLVVFLLTVTFASGQYSPGHTDLTAKEFYEQISDPNGIQLIDVRTSAEFEKGRLEHAVNIDWKQPDFLDQAASLDKSKPVFVYCLSGGRSTAAAEALRKNKFTAVFELTGGLLKWRAESLPETASLSIVSGMNMQQYKALLTSDKLILVDFHAEWCAPCKIMKPYLEKIALEYADRVSVVRIDVDGNPELCKALQVSALPALKLYKNQKVIWEQTGLVTETTLRELLK